MLFILLVITISVVLFIFYILIDNCHHNIVFTNTFSSFLSSKLNMVVQVLDIISKGGVKGIAHITGGGFTDNIPRVFPNGLGAKIFTNSWEVPSVFHWLQQVCKLFNSIND